MSATKTSTPPAVSAKKRSKRLLAYLLVVLVLIGGAAGALFFLHRLEVEDFKHLKEGYREIPATLKDQDYWKKLFTPDKRLK